MIIMDYKKAKEILIGLIQKPDTEIAGIDVLKGRILAEDIKAAESVPAFDRSPYDGYAFIAADTEGADKEQGISLKVMDDIRAGQVSSCRITKGTAVRLMTGAPLPEGADAICKYEDTEEIINNGRHEAVIIKREYRKGENVIRAGEDIKEGTLLALKGTVIDTGLIGTMASLGMTKASVYKRPLAGIISTGDEVVDTERDVPTGKIRNSNRYTVAAALAGMGIDSVYLGHSGDTRDEMKDLILKGDKECDLIISTGGVSAGDYDIVPEAMEDAGFKILVHGVKIKPGMACAYGVKAGKLMLALSGNPASSLTNLQCVCMPALRKLCGCLEYDHKIIKMRLKNDHTKGSKGIRFIRGRLIIENGEAVLDASNEQGNIVISSTIGCNAYGILEDTGGPVAGGTLIEGFVI